MGTKNEMEIPKVTSRAASDLDLFDDFEREIADKVPEAQQTDIDEMQQRTVQWFLARWDKFTGSKIPALMKQGIKKDQKWGETAKKVILELASYATMTPEGREQYAIEQMYKDFRATRWGNTYEPEARDLYSARTGMYVNVTGFTCHPTIGYLGGSFDGEIIDQEYDQNIDRSFNNRRGIIEIKCPYDPVKHLENENLQRVGLDKSHEYYGQIQNNIEVAGVDWCDFISYDPRQTDPHKLIIIRVVRDQIYIDAMLDRVHKSKRILDGYLAGRSIDEMCEEVEQPEN